MKTFKRDYVYGMSTITQNYVVSSGDGVKSETFAQDQVATVLEPLLILTMGVVVMLIVLAVMLPIIQLNQWVK